MPQLERTLINPSAAPQPLGAYSLASQVTAGKLIFLAGQVGVDNNGNLTGSGDIGSQTRQVFDNLGKVLAGVGADFSNVVEFTSYLVGRSSVQGFIEARTQIFPTIFPNADFPPNTLLIVDGLVREDLLVEVKAVAALP